MRIVRNLLSSIFYFAGKLTGRASGPRVLCYHRVNDEQKNYLTVPAADFAAQMKFLSGNGYRSISLSELLAGKGDSKCVVITFDDGYEDNYLHAFPAMKQYGLTGIVFCVAGKVGEKDYLTTPEIQEMRKAGFEFGSHTISHPNLQAVSIEEKRTEIRGSKDRLEKMFGAPVEYFCYPYGRYDEDAWKIVKESGYKGACCNAPGAAGKIDNPFLLKRTEIANTDTLWDFEKKLAGAYDTLHLMLHLLRGRP